MDENKFYPDIVVYDHRGSIWEFAARSDAGEDWLAANIHSRFVERRFVDDILDGAWADGLVVGAYVGGRLGELVKREAS